jgi:hypothetical protein
LPGAEIQAKNAVTHHEMVIVCSQKETKPARRMPCRRRITLPVIKVKSID